VFYGTFSTNRLNAIEVGNVSHRAGGKHKYHAIKQWQNTTRSSADADNRLDAFSGQSRSTNMVPCHVLHVTALNVTTFLKSNIVQEAQLMLTNLRDG